jgi:hypothetical protein
VASLSHGAEYRFIVENASDGALLWNVGA